MATIKKNKNKNKNNINITNGITITDSISLTINSTRYLNPKLILILISLSGIVGFSVSFLSLFNFNCNIKLLAFSIAAAFIFFSALFMFPSRSKFFLIPVYLLIGAGIYRHITSIVHGYSVFINTIAHTLRIVGSEYSYYSIPQTVDQEACVTVFLIFLFIVITSIICYNTIIKPRFIFVFCCTFPFIELGLYFGYSPSHLPFFLLVAYWIAVFSMRVAGNQFHSTSGQPVFVRKRNMFISTGNLRNNVIETIGLITLFAVFAIFLISQAILGLISYERSEKINQTRSNIKTSVSEITLDKLIDSMAESSKKNPVSDTSRLGNMDSIYFTDRTDLTVMISDKFSDNIYLKGFTGSEYKNNTWHTFSDDDYQKYSKTFDIFNSNGCYPQNFNFINNSVLSGIMPDKFQKRQLIINSTFSSNPYLFVPYGVSIKGNMTPNYDNIITSNDMKSYTYSFITTPDLYKDISIINSNIENFSKNSSFSESESSYRKFVYDKYLDLPDNKDIDSLCELYRDIPEYNGLNIEEIYQSIKDILHSSASYSLKPGRTPANRELTYYMLTENHKGYCSHFATAATVLARLSGIPARYAEGYVIVPDDLEKATTVNSYYKIDIHDSRAHAWTEFYIDGYGWVPFEFTPGYDRGIVSSEEDHSKDPEYTKSVEVTKPVTDSVSSSTKPGITAPVTSSSEQTPGNSVSLVPSAQVTTEHSDKGNNNSSFFDTIRNIFILLFTVVLIAVIIYTVHVITIRRRILSFHGKSNRQNIINIYKYMIKLLNYYGIFQSNMLPLEFAAYAEENAQDISESGTITLVIKYALASSFSNTEPDDSQIISAIDITYHIASKIFESQTRYRKLIFRYILHLIK